MKITGSGSGGENQAISSAWNEMLGEADERLCQLLAQKVVGTTGREPQMQEVRAFLKSLHVEVSPADTKEAEPRVKSGWYSINGGHRIRSRGAINVVKGALNALADAIPNFMEIYEVKSREYIDARQKTHRYWIADDPRKIHVDPKVDYQRATDPLRSGWWITNKPEPKEWRNVLEMAKQVAQQHGIDLNFEIP